MVDHDGHTLEIETEMIEVTNISEPDPHWKQTDAAGHLHMASEDDFGMISYPTLELRTGEPETDEDGEEWTPTWRVCRLCGATVVPGLRSGRTRFMQGLTSYKIDGRHVDEATAREFASAFQRALNARNQDRDRREGYL